MKQNATTLNYFKSLSFLFVCLTLSFNAQSQNENAINFKEGRSTELDVIQTGHNAILPFDDINASFSVDFWVRFTRTGLRYFISKGVNTTSGNTSVSRIAFGINSLNALTLMLVDGTSGVINTVNSNKTTNIRDGNWHHIAFVMRKQSNQVIFFVNGDSSVVNTSFSINVPYGGVGSNSNENFRIGFEGAGSTGEYSGDLDELRIWNTDKTTDLLTASFRNNATNVSQVGSTLCLYYRFNQGTANGNNTSITSVTDISGNGLNGSFSNFNRSGDSSNFVTDTKSLPTLSSNSQICSGTFTANWFTPSYNSSTVSGYMMDVSTVSSFSSFVYQNISLGLVNTYKVSGLNNGTNYFYRIRTINTLSNSNSNYNSSTAITPAACTRTWTGTSSSTWTNANNWSTSISPEPYDNVIIPAVTNVPQLSGNVYVGNIEFSGSSPRLKLSNTLGDTLTISGSITGSSDGSFEGNSNAHLMLTNTTASNTLRMYNPNGASTENQLRQLTLSISGQTLTLGNILKIGSTLQINNGSILATGGNLTLLASSSGTARIGKMGTGASISGTVKSSIFVPSGLRAFRFLGHPFNTAISVGQLKTGIILTGSGGATNGFDSSYTNNPSAFLYNNANGNSGRTPDPGWTAITDGNTQTLNWPAGAGLRVLVRGDRDQGLTGATPNESTITLEGNVNDGGNVTTFLSNSGSSTYNLVANPYCSNIDLNLCSSNNVSSTVYIWDLAYGSRGAYQALSYVSSGNCIIPPYTSFFMVNTSSTQGSNTASFTFNENAKVTQNNSAGRALKGAPQQLIIELLGDSTIKWDKFEMNVDPKYSSKFEFEDGIKFLNPEISLYSLLETGEKLAIDYRKNEKQMIQLGIDGLVSGNYTFDFSKSTLPNGAMYYLIDGANRMKIDASLKYAFTLNAQDLSELKNRFKIEIESAPNSVIENSIKPQVSVFPNPASNILYIKREGNSKESFGIQLMQIDGKQVAQYTWENTSDKIEIPTSHLPIGLYLLVIEGTHGKIIEKVLVGRD